ncbi:hypothetical protein Q31a_09740 [Aureliella helgolandensis]|uniref:Uncharacterized protein n=1 Tax=Aureliella helgolandensis TaxID=2527968 RepID=A0A518G263_9BACT|nr:hypothetical protein Q31a_09740 [Aureliella helgolandensis]
MLKLWDAAEPPVRCLLKQFQRVDGMAGWSRPNLGLEAATRGGLQFLEQFLDGIRGVCF